MQADNVTVTLRQVASQACKTIDIGTAILPKPLFEKDHDESMGNATVSIAATTDASASTCNTIATTRTSHGDSHSQNESTTYANIVSSEFNSIVIEHHLKWAPLCHTLPGPINESTPSTRLGRYDFSHVDSMVDWALERNMKVKGHVLVWHVTTPEYVNDLSADQIREELKRHIFTTMGHFRGRIKCWDVVNESLAPDGTLAENIFFKKLGPSYIEQCFRWAHEADPTAFLIYNDNKVEAMDGPNQNKSNGFFHLLKDLIDRGTPIHGAGMQAHFNAGGVEDRQRVPTPHQVKKQIRRIGDLGLKVNISEMDVRISKLPENVRERAQNEIYHDILSAALSEPAFDGIWLWGFSDRHTWVKNFYYDDAPLLFDEEYNRKKSYYAVRDALQTIGVNGKVGGGVCLDSDCDENGLPWGHSWMPAPILGGVDDNNGLDEGDSRPDWLQS